MVLRSDGWHIIALAAACLAAASAISGAGAMDLVAPQPPADIPGTTGSVSAAAPPGRLVWGGTVPPAPIPGVSPVYVPSPAYSAERSYGSPQPAPMQPAADQPAYAAPPSLGALPPTGGGYGEGAPSEAERSTEQTAALPPLDGGYDGASPAPAAVRSGPTDPLPPLDGGYGEAYPTAEPRLEAALPPLGEPQAIDDGAPAGLYGSVPEEQFDPWEGLTDVTPGIVPPPAAAKPSVPSYAALGGDKPSRRLGRQARGSLEAETPTGYRAMPKSEAMCRRELQKLGAKFTDVSALGSGRGCGIQNPLKLTQAVKGIAMQPAATLNCQTALRVARWLKDEVKPAARWRLWKRPTAVLNASSYRCSRIAGSATISEHASGNALDVRGFRFSDGSTVAVEPKGFFSPRERKFQHVVRTGGCKYFGTVLGPGYNRAHADHLHLDSKARMRPVCK